MTLYSYRQYDHMRPDLGVRNACRIAGVSAWRGDWDFNLSANMYQASKVRPAQRGKGPWYA